MSDTDSRPVTALIAVGAGLMGLLWVLAFLLFPRHDPAAILHYSSLVGIDFIGQGSQIMVLPTVGTVLLALDVALYVVLRPIDRRAAVTVLTAAPLTAVILVAAFLVLWRVNV